MQSAKLYEIISSYNRFWSTGSIDAGIERGFFLLASTS
jgi:hypothetical protein